MHKRLVVRSVKQESTRTTVIRARPLATISQDMHNGFSGGLVILTHYCRGIRKVFGNGMVRITPLEKRYWRGPGQIRDLLACFRNVLLLRDDGTVDFDGSAGAHREDAGMPFHPSSIPDGSGPHRIVVSTRAYLTLRPLFVKEHFPVAAMAAVPLPR